MLISICMLSACGFHLRGMIDVPSWLTDVAIVSPVNNPEFTSRLKAQLEAYKISVNPDPASATYWLVLNQAEFNQQIVSIGASTNPRQYHLSLLIGFTIQTKNGKIIQPQKNIQINRQFTSNNDRILGSDFEQTVIVNEMRQEAVNQVINRIPKQYHAN